MKKLLSLPPNLVECFHDITGHSREEWFCTHDPVGQKLGSGGGTAWLLQQAHAFLQTSIYSPSFSDWLSSEKRILLHAGGLSRRGKFSRRFPCFVGSADSVFRKTFSRYRFRSTSR